LLCSCRRYAVDPEDAHASAAEKRAKIANQRERQDTALVIQRIATSLLERTRLHVRVTCQAVHASNPRHMLIDMIDYIEPTMVIIGSRGLSKIKGSARF
jgi:nucleotide-binding universal stress UspA family protein